MPKHRGSLPDPLLDPALVQQVAARLSAAQFHPGKSASSVRQKPGQIVAAPQRQSSTLAGAEDARFAEVVALIESARNRAFPHHEKVSPLVTQLPCTLAEDEART